MADFLETDFQEIEFESLEFVNEIGFRMSFKWSNFESQIRENPNQV